MYVAAAPPRSDGARTITEYVESRTRTDSSSTCPFGARSTRTTGTPFSGAFLPTKSPTKIDGMSSVVSLRFSDFRRPDPGPPTARTVPFFPKSIRNREAELPLAHRPPASLSSLPYERQRESGQRKTPWLTKGF